MKAAYGGHCECSTSLIKAGADLNTCSTLRNTALILAVSNGHYECVRSLITAGADVNVNNTDGVTALMSTPSKKKEKCLNALIEAGADVNGKGKVTIPKRDKHVVVRPPNDVLMLIKDKGITLIPTSKPDKYYTTTMDDSDFSPLMLSVTCRDPRYVKLLLNAGADVTQKSSLGTTALLFAIKGASEPCTKALLKAGADVNTSNIHGTMALEFAAYYGQVNIIDQLIKAGADVKNSGENKIIPLFLATQTGHNSYLEKLLYAGADVNAKTSNGFTPLMQAILARHAKCVDTLITAGADVNIVVKLKVWSDDIVKKKEAVTTTKALYLVADNVIAEVQQKAEYKFEDMKTKEAKFTCLGFAILADIEKCVPSLIEAGANVNVSVDLKSPLICAADRGQIQVVNYLIRSGADVNCSDHTGMTGPSYSCNKRTR